MFLLKSLILSPCLSESPSFFTCFSLNPSSFHPVFPNLSPTPLFFFNPSFFHLLVCHSESRTLILLLYRHPSLLPYFSKSRIPSFTYFCPIPSSIKPFLSLSLSNHTPLLDFLSFLTPFTTFFLNIPPFTHLSSPPLLYTSQLHCVHAYNHHRWAPYPMYHHRWAPYPIYHHRWARYPIYHHRWALRIMPTFHAYQISLWTR